MNTIRPRNLKFFDYVATASAAGLSEIDLAAIEKGTRSEYGSDDMLFELRMLRTCKAIRDRHTTTQAVLAELRDSEASAA